MIKGKTAYLSPEQVVALPIDRRSDIFSVGIVLYELLCGPRPFTGESELSVMEAIRDVRYTPPGALDPDLAPGLTAIVARALAREPQARYQWASEMVVDLEAFLFSRGELISARDVAGYIKNLVGGTRAVLAAEVIAPDPDADAEEEGITSATRPLKSRGKVRLPPVRMPVPPPAAAVPPPPPLPMAPTEIGPPPQRPVRSGPPPPARDVITDVGPEPMAPTEVGPLPVRTPVTNLRTDPAFVEFSSAPSRLPAPSAKLGITTDVVTAPEHPAVAGARPLMAAAGLAAFIVAVAAGYTWYRNGHQEEEAAVAAAPAPAPEVEPAPVAEQVNAAPAPTPTPAPAMEPSPPSAPLPSVPAKVRSTPTPDKTTVAAAPRSPVTQTRAPPVASPEPAAPPSMRTDRAYLNLRSNRPAEIVIDGKLIGRSPQLPLRGATGPP